MDPTPGMTYELAYAKFDASVCAAGRDLALQLAVVCLLMVYTAPLAIPLLLIWRSKRRECRLLNARRDAAYTRAFPEPARSR